MLFQIQKEPVQFSIYFIIVEKNRLMISKLISNLFRIINEKKIFFFNIFVVVILPNFSGEN